jgi:type IV secretory pathway TraG/TraD family ATPase VirD4
MPPSALSSRPKPSPPEACGEHGIVTASESASASRSARLLAPATRSTGTQRSERGRRLVTPSEILADARTDEQFVFVTSRCAAAAPSTSAARR